MPRLRARHLNGCWGARPSMSRFTQCPFLGSRLLARMLRKDGQILQSAMSQAQQLEYGAPVGSRCLGEHAPSRHLGIHHYGSSSFTRTSARQNS